MPNCTANKWHVFILSTLKLLLHDSDGLCYSFAGKAKKKHTINQMFYTECNASLGVSGQNAESAEISVRRRAINARMCVCVRLHV